MGRSLDDLPLVYQWNKRDLRDALPVRTLEAMLNPKGRPSASAIASHGEGVLETQQLILKKVVASIQEQMKRGASA
jgi:hypothetical protein